MAAAKAQQDFWKSFTDFKAPNVDVSGAFTTYRRNLETLSAVNQKLVEGAQAAAKHQAEALRENAENFISATKDILTSNSPESNTTKQINLVKSWYENALNNAREVAELVSKSGTDAYALINKRATETWEEINKATKNS
jgi:phasin family protein